MKQLLAVANSRSGELRSANALDDDILSMNPLLEVCHAATDLFWLEIGSMFGPGSSLGQVASILLALPWACCSTVEALPNAIYF
jgi:hypothetical protein